MHWHNSGERAVETGRTRSRDKGTPGGMWQQPKRVGDNIGEGAKERRGQQRRRGRAGRDIREERAAI